MVNREKEMAFNNAKKSNNYMQAFFKKITVKNIFKLLISLIIITVYVLLLGRMYLASDRGIMAKYSPTDIYFDNCNDNTVIYTQNLNYTMDETGYYRVSNLAFIPEIGELQINVRYNDSTLDKLAELYPEFEYNGEPFVYELVDNNNNVYKLNGYITKTNLIYNFRKLLFENIDFNTIERLYLDVKLADGDDSDSEMDVRFTIYNSADQTVESELKIDNTKNNKFIK